MISLSLFSALSAKFQITDINLFIINVIIAVLLVVIGVFLGNFLKFILRRIIQKSDMQKTAKRSFIELFLTIIKWSIYIIFIVLALDQIGIPQLTNWITSILVVIPALVGAILLIAIGFGLAIYLRGIIEDSNIVDKKVLSMVFFYFILYVFLIFALKTSLIAQDKSTVNMVIIILTAIISAAVAWWHVRK